MSEKKPKPVKEKKAKKPPKGEAMKGEAGEEGEEGAPKKKKMAGKTLILFIVAPLVLLGGGGAAAFLLLAPKDKPAHEEAESHGAEEPAGDDSHGEKKDSHGKKDKKADKKKKDSHGKEAKSDKGGHGGAEGATTASIREGDGVFYYTLPDILVNIGGSEGKSAYLKLKLTIEAKTEEPLLGIEPELPRVLDLFQAFLRELRIDDLNGSTGSYRLRVELLRRLNLAIAPAEAEAVLIEEMLIQ